MGTLSQIAQNRKWVAHSQFERRSRHVNRLYEALSSTVFPVLTAEHFVKITDTIYASLFYDAGNVWERFGDINFADLKRGAGVGVQIDLPGFGPMGLDYAYGFQREAANGVPDPGWQLHFRFGNFGR